MEKRITATCLLACAALCVSTWAAPENQAIAERISKCIVDSGKLTNFRIGVHFKDGTATLSGAVSSEADLDRVVKIVEKSAEVKKVVNQLKVSPEPKKPLFQRSSGGKAADPTSSTTTLPKKGSAPEVAVETKEGACSFREDQSQEDEAPIEIGKKLKVTCRFDIPRFGVREGWIFVGPHLSNTSATTMYCSLHIAFFDKDGKLVGCASQELGDRCGVAPGNDTNLASCSVFIPEDARKKVTSYKIVFYESDQPIRCP